MPWLRVDDRMYANRKLRPISNDATALWVWAMDYSSDQLTDGVLAPDEVQMLAGMRKIADWQQVAAELVDAGLFERDGANYIVHDYLVYNPSREKVLEDRAANAKRQAEYQAKKKSAPAEAEANQPTNDVSNAVTNLVPYPVPSPYPGPDPVPVPNEDHVAPSGAESDGLQPPKRSKRPRQPDTELPPQAFRDFWQEYPRKKARAEAEKAFQKALKSGVTPETLRAGATNYAQECRLACREEQFTLLPATFLNKRRFEDYQTAPDPTDFAPRIVGSARASPATKLERSQAAADRVAERLKQGGTYLGMPDDP